MKRLKHREAGRNIIITKVFEYFFLLSLKGSLVAVGILIIKAIFKQKLSARLQYGIWFILILKLLIPFSVESPVNFVSQFSQVKQVLENTENSSSDTKGQMLTDITNQNLDSSSYGMVKSTVFYEKLGINLYTAAVIWLLGGIDILIYIVLVNISQFIKMKKYVFCRDKDTLRILEECKTKLRINFEVSLLLDDRLRSPMLYGIIHPKIIISKKVIKELSKEEIRYIFLHELSHVKRRDLSVNVAALLIQTVYWFNPIILYSIYKMKQDCEISCDATVLKVLNQDEYIKYGLTIIQMMKMISESRWVPGTVGFASKYNKRRITMIKFYKNASIKWSAVALFTLVLLTGCTSITGVSEQTSAESSTSQETGTDTSATDNSVDDNSVPEQNTTETVLPETIGDTTDTASDGQTVDTANSFVNLFAYLGLNKEDLISVLGEEPVNVDEGGLEFKNAGIRIWFDQVNYAVVAQVFTQREDIDFNGAKIGDSIEEFKKAFGEPISDKNGDMHFKYADNEYISVDYDISTNKTFAVYLLSEDF